MDQRFIAAVVPEGGLPDPAPRRLMPVKHLGRIGIKAFNFQLKQPIKEARYNELWLEIERKNGRIQ